MAPGDATRHTNKPARKQGRHLPQTERGNILGVASRRVFLALWCNDGHHNSNVTQPQESSEKPESNDEDPEEREEPGPQELPQQVSRGAMRQLHNFFTGNQPIIIPDAQGAAASEVAAATAVEVQHSAEF